jgi:glycosyltransferase involved in cell wall biosynthesis
VEAVSTADITVVIPTVAPRIELLKQALASVAQQELMPAAVVIQEDTARLGAPATRQAGMDRVNTEAVAFLDDDDLLKREHLRVLWDAMQRTGADVVYPWFEVTDAHGVPIPGGDPWPERFGRPWDRENPYLFPISYLARTDVVRAAGGFVEGASELYGHRLVSGEDWRLILHMNEIATIVHEPAKTWVWRHWGGNASGLPEKVNWDTVYWRPTT